ncbi:DUF4012 domain-containing protein [Microbacterium radiodurans]|uniref:DUF4012 domain-containing protein n=1 Tax=Microbacterium radiodurans TaxID=661398 RepID=A0A5J5IRL0_9MICO|nr:DUF4012 domain-containing protein [Microbacterium radiodurans]KAA9087069.1 DUF4012 domain-containing protein [Microbacterium radiodurans]
MVLACAVVALVLVAVVAWLGVRGALAARELGALRASAAQVQRAAAERDLPALRQAVTEATAHAEAARSLTDDPVWRAAEVLPGIGPNAAAVRLAAASVAELGSGAQPLLASDLGSTLSGGLDLSTALTLLADAGPLLDDASASAGRAAATIDTIDTDALLGPVRDGVAQLDETVTPVASWLAGAADAAQWVPGMLGADGPRSVLVALQNSAELRSGGGLTGSFLLVTFDRGTVTLADQVDSGDFPVSREPVGEIPDTTRALYGDVVGTYVQNATMTADFSLSAQLLSAWWSRHSDRAPDAVVSIDPIVLRTLLAATGPVALEDGTSLTADSLIDTLLVKPYLDLSGPEQSVYQRGVTTAVVQRALGGPLDARALISGLGEALGAGRISIWSPDPAVQRHLDGSAVAGMRARQLAAGEDAFAVLLNDATTAKLDSWLRMDVGSTVSNCRGDDRDEVSVTVRLTNTAPAEAATYPPSMTGGYNPASPGDLVTDVAAVAPEGWFFGAVAQDGDSVPSRLVVDGGLPTSAARVTLSPGATSTLQFRFVAPDADPVEPTLVHTPLLSDVGSVASVGQCL